MNTTASKSRRKPLTPHYSGELSRAFWLRVKRIEDERTHDLLYLAGCALQDHEERVLQMFAALEIEELYADH